MERDSCHGRARTGTRATAKCGANRLCGRSLPAPAPLQEEELVALLDLWSERTASLTRRREKLLARAASAAAGDPGRPHRLLHRVAALQDLYQVTTTVFFIAANCSLLNADQFAAYVLAAAP